MSKKKVIRGGAESIRSRGLRTISLPVSQDDYDLFSRASGNVVRAGRGGKLSAWCIEQLRWAAREQLQNGQ